MTKSETCVAARELCLVLGGVLMWFLSEWTGCNSSLVPEASKQNCSLPSVHHKTAVTVILLEYY